jgi:hypothetical protein
MRGILLVLGVLGLACGHGQPTGTRTAMATPGGPTDGRGPEPLSQDEILEGMQRALNRMRTCPLDPPGSEPPRVRVEVATNGRVSQVRTLGLLNGTPASSCREQAIKLLVFRANPGISFDYAFPLD